MIGLFKSAEAEGAGDLIARPLAPAEAKRSDFRS
jgi:hypothetical protein